MSSWSTFSHAIAAAVEVEVTRHDAPVVAEVTARRAIRAKEAELGRSLTVGQHGAVLATTTSARGVELIVGVAGSGKTTALAAVREAFEAEGYRVIGTSTSGQAARTLGRAAGIEPSRTLASLTWRLSHGQESLDERTVVVLDEAAMAEDAMLLQLFRAAALARSKVVVVGDHLQLGAVGPGGGFDALVARFGDAVHVLADNVRQHNVAERAALAQLRDGNVARAVAWYARDDRIVVARDRAEAVEKLVEGWAADVAEHESVAMYAYRRANVAELNRRGRDVWRSLGRLGEAELVAPGGARYAEGDRVVTLAPGAGGKVVTSETGTVVGLRPDATALLLRVDDDGEVRGLEGEEISASRLAHSYAVTVHRSQGSTVEMAHALEDGGGRELAYVKMSRARERSTVYVVADSVAQAQEHLRWEWGTDRRVGWVIDIGVPIEPEAVERTLGVPEQLRDTMRLARLRAEREAILAVVPHDPSIDIRIVERERQRLAREREDLAEAKGRYQSHPVARAHRDLQQARREIAQAEALLARRDRPRKLRRMDKADLVRSRTREAAALGQVNDLSATEFDRMDEEERGLGEELSSLQRQGDAYDIWSAQHPEAANRLDHLTATIETLSGVPFDPIVAAERAREIAWTERSEQLALQQSRGLSRGLDLGR